MLRSPMRSVLAGFLAPVLVPGLLLASLGCTRVPATLEIGEAEASGGGSSTPTQTREPGEGQGFDVEGALATAEHALLAVDEIRSRPGPRPYSSEEMYSYLEDEGLRSLYFYARLTDVSLWSLAATFDAPVFVDGPHGDHPSFEAESFGHYNPVFVERVTATARALANDRARVERTREAFERQLGRQALTYLLVYEAIHRDPAWYARLRDAEQRYLADRSAGFDIWTEEEPMCEAFAAAGYSWYETATAASFWVRRDLDGTAAAWREAVEVLLHAYGVDTTIEPPGFPRARP